MSQAHIDDRAATSVKFDAVTKQYESETEAILAVEDISLDVEEGEFVSIVGPSGCGKSTLLHLTSGIFEPTEGTVTVNDIDVQSANHEESRVGIVFQEPVLLDWRNVMENIMFPVTILSENGLLDRDYSYYEKRASDLLELVGLEEFENAYPNELSGGMKQRVAICQSLIYDPEVLLMDEPFGALDALTKGRMNDELLNIWEQTQKTILFVTHDLEEAVYLSDRVVILSDRPASILDVVDVDLPRPRDEETRRTDRFMEIKARCHDYFTE